MSEFETPEQAVFRFRQEIEERKREVLERFPFVVHVEPTGRIMSRLQEEFGPCFFAPLGMETDPSGKWARPEWSEFRFTNEVDAVKAKMMFG